MTTTEYAHTEIWQHAVSGEWFLVSVAPDGTLLNSNGPVARDDAEYCVNEGAGFFNGTDEDNEWLAAQPMRVVYP